VGGGREGASNFAQAISLTILGYCAGTSVGPSRGSRHWTTSRHPDGINISAPQASHSTRLTGSWNLDRRPVGREGVMHHYSHLILPTRKGQPFALIVQDARKSDSQCRYKYQT